MFGTRIVNRLIYDTLAATAGVTAVVGTRIVRGTAYPQETQLPALRFYPEQGAYDQLPGPVASAYLTAETLRYVVAVDDAGTSDTRIAPAAEAQLAALAGLIVDTDDGHQVTFAALGEVPLTSYVDGDRIYQRLGTIYSVTVTRGG